MSMTRPRKNRAGDTIVEVMIAVIVLGAALGAAIAIATKSQKQSQANHEYHQAQLLANQQAEYLLTAFNTALSSSVENYSDTRDDFYNNLDTTYPEFCYFVDGSNNLVADNSAMNSNCVKNDGGAEYEISVDIVSPADPADPKKFVITVRWDSLTPSTASDQDNVELIYAL